MGTGDEEGEKVMPFPFRSTFNRAGAGFGDVRGQGFDIGIIGPHNVAGGRRRTDIRVGIIHDNN